MKSMTGKFLERCRVTGGQYASDRTFGFNGKFFLPHPTTVETFQVVCSDGMGWEHVSASLPERCPTWEEMCWVKDQFWDEHEAVIQIHPPRSEYVNNHPHCLHLWRPTCLPLPLPPSFMVGVKEPVTA